MSRSFGSGNTIRSSRHNPERTPIESGRDGTCMSGILCNGLRCGFSNGSTEWHFSRGCLAERGNRVADLVCAFYAACLIVVARQMSFSSVRRKQVFPITANFASSAGGVKTLRKLRFPLLNHRLSLYSLLLKGNGVTLISEVRGPLCLPSS